MVDIAKGFKTDIHIKIVSFFHENQASVDTPRGIATWTGYKKDDVKKALVDLVEIGILSAHPVSSTTGYSYTNDKNTIEAIDKKLKELKNNVNP
jgi:transcription initiation factor IIE alpha subunit